MVTSKTPKIDLHGEPRSLVYALVTEFINYQSLLGVNELVIIHGKSSDILKNEVHEVLKNNSKVDDYYLNNWNLGETIVLLKK